MSILGKKLCSLHEYVVFSSRHANRIQHLRKTCNRSISLSHNLHNHTVCVVGSGPAGFGITQYLLKNNDTLQVKMLDRSPIPYGLIRYGVSPDHQDVKNCIHGYERVAENSRFSFYGGADVGKNVSLKELSEVSDAIVLCTGAQKESKLGIPGENLKNVFTAKEFVGWYNGVPEYSHIKPNLAGETVGIIGVGNVALDCARMLLTPTPNLHGTDITAVSYNTLTRSNVKNVVLIGRRGPLQMACTRRELSEIVDRKKVNTIISHDCITPEIMEALSTTSIKNRKTIRMVKYLLKSTRKKEQNLSNNFIVELLQSPLELLSKNEKVCGILLLKNEMTGDDPFNPKITATDITKTIDCGMVISCIGYGNEPIDSTIPFSNGKITTNRGKIEHDLTLYACGWCKNGAKGVLADTLNDCLITGKTLVGDLKNMIPTATTKNIDDLLLEKGIKTLSWKDWNVLDKYEIKRGSKSGKIREKILSTQEMFDIAHNDDKNAAKS